MASMTTPRGTPFSLQSCVMALTNSVFMATQRPPEWQSLHERTIEITPHNKRSGASPLPGLVKFWRIIASKRGGKQRSFDALECDSIREFEILGRSRGRFRACLEDPSGSTEPER